MVSASDVQRLYMQAILSRGVLSEKLAKILWQKCIQAVNDTSEMELPCTGSVDDWMAFTTVINDSLNSLDLEFRHLSDELTGKTMYAVVNRKGDEVAQLATDYSPNEIAFFKAVVEQIMLAPAEAYSVSSLIALREVNNLKATMTKTQAEVLFGSLVGKGWLLKSQRGRYSLSTRSLLELTPYLKQTYAEDIVLECTVCMDMITRGVACKTNACKARLHFHCYTQYIDRKDKCPACNSDWPKDADDMGHIGENALKDDGQEERLRKAQARNRKADGEGGSDDEEEAQDSDEPKQTQRIQRTQRKAPAAARKKRISKRADSMEVEEEEEEEEEEDEDGTPPPRAQGARRSGRQR